MRRLDYNEIPEFENHFVNQIRSVQQGNGFPVFKEYRQKGGILPVLPALYLYHLAQQKKYGQNGDGWGSFFRGMFKTVLPAVKSVGKSAAKELFNTGVDIVRDVSLGHDWKSSAKKRFEESGDRVIEKTKAKVDKYMTGSGRKRTRSRKSKRKSKNVTEKSIQFQKKLLSLIGPPKKIKNSRLNKWI